MINCERFVNSRFTSNTYIISHSNYDNVWVVDPGDTEVIFEWMKNHSKTTISGILLTHAHFDHIYGVNEIISHNPRCVIYISNEYGKEALYNPKTNGSKYTEEGAVVIVPEAIIFFYTETMHLWPNVMLRTFNTPGHSDDSQCFIVDRMLFTGDTLIKDVRTVTKLKGGSVEKLNMTAKILAKLKGQGLMVMPGHEEEFLLDDYKLERMTRIRLDS